MSLLASLNASFDIVVVRGGGVTFFRGGRLSRGGGSHRVTSVPPPIRLKPASSIVSSIVFASHMND